MEEIPEGVGGSVAVSGAQATYLYALLIYQTRLGLELHVR
jgi:hypothetical protein